MLKNRHVSKKFELPMKYALLPIGILLLSFGCLVSVKVGDGFIVAGIGAATVLFVQLILLSGMAAKIPIKKNEVRILTASFLAGLFIGLIIL